MEFDLDGKWEDFCEYCLAILQKTDCQIDDCSSSIFLSAGGQCTEELLQKWRMFSTDIFCKIISDIQKLEVICLMKIIFIYEEYKLELSSKKEGGNVMENYVLKKSSLIQEAKDVSEYISNDAEGQESGTHTTSAEGVSNTLSLSRHLRGSNRMTDSTTGCEKTPTKYSLSEDIMSRVKHESERKGCNNRMAREKTKAKRNSEVCKESENINSEIKSPVPPTEKNVKQETGLKNKVQVEKKKLAKQTNLINEINVPLVQKDNFENPVENSHIGSEEATSYKTVKEEFVTGIKVVEQNENVVKRAEEIAEKNLSTVPIVCSVCSESFSTSKALLYHWKKLHTAKSEPSTPGSKAKPFLCNLCNETFPAYYLLKLHHCIHTGVKPHRCDQCGKGFRLMKGLTAHLKTHSKEKPYKCHLCPASFTQKRGLNLHSVTHTGQRDHICEDCGKRCASLTNLKVHRRVHTGEKPYRCHLCQAAFTQSSTLNMHLRIHDGNKQYKCDHCDMSFVTKSHLTTHLRRHTGDRPYSCSQCPYRGSTPSMVRIHSLVHSAAKPFHCEQCDATFKRKTHLAAHARTHRRKQTYSCCSCAALFVNARGLKQHKCQLYRKDNLQLQNSSLSTSSALVMPPKLVKQANTSSEIARDVVMEQRFCHHASYHHQSGLSYELSEVKDQWSTYQRQHTPHHLQPQSSSYSNVAAEWGCHEAATGQLNRLPPAANLSYQQTLPVGNAHQHSLEETTHPTNRSLVIEIQRQHTPQERSFSSANNYVQYDEHPSSHGSYHSLEPVQIMYRPSETTKNVSVSTIHHEHLSPDTIDTTRSTAERHNQPSLLTI